MKAAKRRSSTGSIWVAAGIAVVAVGVLIGFSLWSSQTKVDPASVSIPEVKSDTELNATRFTIGNPNAKSELVEYGDFL